METKVRRLIAVVLLGLSCADSGWAFDPHTHAVMTSEAVAQSRFGRNPNNSNTFLTLGLLDFDLAYGSRYIDMGETLRKRDGQATIENAQINMLRDLIGSAVPIADNYSLAGWVMRGAIREDDNPLETPESDEPGGVFRRVFGHFFDPANDRALTALGIPAGDRATDWALRPFATVDLGRRNSFNVVNAREAMWRALTLKAKTSSGEFNDDIQPVDWLHTTKEDLRKAYWATTFRSLGDVVHLLQDMAQPQHTRNDMHSGLGCIPGTGTCALGHASFFENYLRARTLQTGQFTMSEGIGTPTPGDPRFTNAKRLNYNNDPNIPSYPKPAFNSYADFFSTGTGWGNVAAGKGLANYSNRGFYSFGTNINSSNANSFPLPPADGSGLQSVLVSGASLVDMAGEPLPGGVVEFKVGSVTDTVTGQPEPNVKLSAKGLWDQFLEQRNLIWSRYSLNHYNYDDQAKLLVPRAVAYSAGLIDYFFRGKLTVSLPDEGVYGIVDHKPVESTAPNPPKGFSKIRLKVMNATESVAGVPQHMEGGKLVAVVKFYRNTCYTEDLSGEWGAPAGVARGPEVFTACRSAEEEILVSGIKDGVLLAGGPNQVFEFIFTPPIPINATDVYLQVVYRGALGSESDAVVVETKDIGEPAFTTYLNATDYLFCHDGVLSRRAALAEEVTAPYPPVQMENLAISYGGDAVATVSSLPAGSFIRYATLGELNHDWRFSFQANGAPNTVNHVIHPADPRMQANQVYYRYDDEARQLRATNFARQVQKIPFGYTASGRTYYLPDNGSCPNSFPEDVGTPPTLLPIVISGAFGTP